MPAQYSSEPTSGADLPAKTLTGLLSPNALHTLTNNETGEKKIYVTNGGADGGKWGSRFISTSASWC